MSADSRRSACKSRQRLITLENHPYIKERLWQASGWRGERQNLIKLLTHFRLTTNESILELTNSGGLFDLMGPVLRDNISDSEIVIMVLQIMLSWLNKSKNIYLHLNNSESLEKILESENETAKSLAEELLAHPRIVPYRIPSPKAYPIYRIPLPKAYRIPKQAVVPQISSTSAGLCTEKSVGSNLDSKQQSSSPKESTSAKPVYCENKAVAGDLEGGGTPTSTQSTQPDNTAGTTGIDSLHGRDVDPRERELEEELQQSSSSTDEHKGFYILPGEPHKGAPDRPILLAEEALNPRSSETLTDPVVVKPPATIVASGTSPMTPTSRTAAADEDVAITDTKEHRLFKLINPVVLDCMAKYAQPLERDPEMYDEKSRILTQKIVDKEKNNPAARDVLTDKMLAKITNFSKGFIARLLRNVEKPYQARAALQHPSPSASGHMIIPTESLNPETEECLLSSPFNEAMNLASDGRPSSDGVTLTAGETVISKTSIESAMGMNSSVDITMAFSRSTTETEQMVGDPGFLSHPAETGVREEETLIAIARVTRCAGQIDLRTKRSLKFGLAQLTH
ncbi:hypothetical protein C8R43DRAFT_1105368 [Mycena crocata]|nr:hypothetical protein C8R43DRAFT_1105368 [Mycena crocata]